MYAVRTTTNVKTRNDRINKNREGRGVVPEASELWDEALGVWQRRMECTHAGKHRDRGDGVRPRHKVRTQGCPAFVSIVVSVSYLNVEWGN